MHGIANEIIDNKSYTTHTKRLARELLQFIRRKMVHEEIGAHKIERVVGKGQSASITCDYSVAAVQVSADAIEKSNFQVEVWGQSLPDFRRNKARTGGDFEQGSAATGMLSEGAAHQVLGCADASEPAVKHLQIAERSSDFALRAGVGIQ